MVRFGLVVVAVAAAFEGELDGAFVAAAAACVTRTNASRPTSRALKRVYLLNGDRGAAHTGPLVSLDRGTLHEGHDVPRAALQMTKNRCHKRNRP